MTDIAGGVPWTDDQWSRARKVVQESARRARVASSFLPLFGPLPAEQVNVSAQVMSTVDNVNGSSGEARQRLHVDTGHMSRSRRSRRMCTSAAPTSPIPRCPRRSP